METQLPLVIPQQLVFINLHNLFVVIISLFVAQTGLMYILLCLLYPFCNLNDIGTAMDEHSKCNSFLKP